MSECEELKRALEILGDKWSGIILWSLENQPKRFVEIQKSTEGINPRTLTSKLHMLENSGLVTKKEFKEYPPRTEYEITEKGRALKPVFSGMREWAKKYN